MKKIQQKNVSLNTLISCPVPGEFCSVADIVIFCCVMRFGSINVTLDIVSTELSGWYSSVYVKYGYHGDDWSQLSPKHTLSILHYYFIPVERHFLMCHTTKQTNWPLFHYKLCLLVRHLINLNSRYDLPKMNITKTNYTPSLAFQKNC